MLPRTCLRMHLPEGNRPCVQSAKADFGPWLPRLQSPQQGRGYASGTLIQYEIEGADGLFMAQERDLRRP